MTSFSKDELYTATEVVRTFSTLLTKIAQNQLTRAVIVKNNRFQAVLLNIDEYERLNDAAILMQDYLAEVKGRASGN